MIDIKLEKKLPVVQINFDEVKASLIAGSEKYKNLVVTENGLKDCKTMQKELSSTRIKLDNYRKEVKKEMTKPITKFEDECKILIALVAEVENPLKAGIEIFNQKVRDEKRDIAFSIIADFITENNLIDKYSKELTVIDKYMNLTAKDSEVMDDVSKRGFLLLQQQEAEIETLQIMNDTIVNLNKNIDAKLSIEDFQSLIDANTSPVKIMSEINARAERIKANELKAIEDRKAKAEKEVLERIAKAEHEAAEKTRIEERNIRIAKEELEYAENAKLKAIAEAAEHEERLKLKAIEDEKNKATEKLEQEAKLREMARNIDLEPTTEKLYFIDMKVTNATLAEVKALSQFLKDNNYDYEATNKGAM